MEVESGRVPLAPGSRASTEPQSTQGLGPTGFDPSRFRFPTEEECRQGARRKWAICGPFNIDQWPDQVRAISIPTKFIEVPDIERFETIFDGGEEVMTEYAEKIDEMVGWDMHFVRLNSRSPKDMTAPGVPLTCSGKQAMFWISGSMRCMDDASLHRLAQKPLFICLREWRPIRPEWEFRCFAKDGEVIAVSRYDYMNPSEVPEEFAPKAMKAAQDFYRQHLAKHYPDVVFDLHAPSSDQELLIELNPYGLSDPCLFGSYEEVEKGGVRISDSDGSPTGGDAEERLHA